VDSTEEAGLRYNPFNAVTQGIDRVAGADGRQLVRKRLGRRKPGAPEHWLASEDLRHWNYWRREAEAYRSRELAASLAGTGLAMPAADVLDTPDGTDLLLEDVEGRPGAEFDLDDHIALARGLGRWQARAPLNLPWLSAGFLRSYSASRPAPADVDAAWQHPLIAGTWPKGLRSGWSRLVRARDRLLDVMESLPRVTAHLDVWPANEIRRDTASAAGEIVLLDWAFCGDGAVGEDVGNHVPDSALDLFWPSDRLRSLDEAVFAAYVAGLRDAGWRGDERVVRLGMVGSCVLRQVHVAAAADAGRCRGVGPPRLPPARRLGVLPCRARTSARVPGGLVRRGDRAGRRPRVVTPSHSRHLFY
jgi:hypothetical protein